MAIHFYAETCGNQKAPPLLLLHGFLGDHRDFAAVIAELKQDFYCMAVDLPGHGQTQVVGDLDQYSWQATAQGLIQWLPTLARPPWHLWGYSLGGRLALYLALTYPHYFARVILESTSPGLTTEAERQQRRQQDQAWIEQLQSRPFEQFLKNWYAQALFQSLRSHPEFPALFQQRLDNRPQALIQSLRYLGLGNQPSRWPDLAMLPMPVLLLAGEQDPKFCQLNRKMLDLIPQGQFHCFQQAGHNLHWEQPQAIVAVVRDFLNSH
ncbi:2-succinyl-6-hydroxy-2,4-cyclohexadiene-1-carboxylate synthase [Synechocystis sp. LKSZ1]|uniref:2-succinyl-6-hydroxy-2, 4-cyclohexadiene-1-carboxylate synthase n=1 Tax=Synechocystis sp. LKSZ1 TaxID=3144951 RepID=UPI00336C06A3